MKKEKFISQGENKMTLLNSSLYKSVSTISKNTTKIITTQVPTNEQVNELHHSKRMSRAQLQYEYEMAKIEEEKFRILQEAMQEAEKIKNQAFNEAYEQGQLAGHNEGYQAGVQEGYQHGFQQSLDETKEMLQEAKNSYQETIEKRNQYVQEVEEDLLETSVRLAEKLLMDTLEQTPEKISNLLSPILLSLEEPDQLITVHAHPKHFEHLDERLQKMKQEILNFRYLLLKDASLSVGQIAIESENQKIEVDVEKELKQVLKNLREIK